MKHSQTSPYGQRRGETGAQFAERCRNLFTSYWRQFGASVEVRIESNEGDKFAIRSNLKNAMPP